MALAAAFDRVRNSAGADGRRECVLCHTLVPNGQYRQHIDDCLSPIDPDDCCIIDETTSTIESAVSTRKRRHNRTR
jgi:hypothetical protein